MPSVGPDAVTAMQPDYQTPRQGLSGPVLSPNAGKGGAGCPRLGQMQSQPVGAQQLRNELMASARVAQRPSLLP